jgi:hypothetical protein
MPNWKKIITSGSDAAFNSIIATNGITGSFTGSLTGDASSLRTTKVLPPGGNVSGIHYPLLSAQNVTGVKIVYQMDQFAYSSSIGLLIVTSSFAQTASLSQTASFARTASYVTGSTFNNSNPALSASYALTASYALNAGNANTATTATTATTADGITSPLSQNLTINGSFDVNTSFGILDTLLDNAFNSGIGYGYSGEILVVDLGRPGFDVAAGISPGDLLSLDNDGIWRLTNNVNASASYMLGFYVQDPNTSDYGILIDGYMVLSGSIDDPRFGRSLFITGSGPVTYTTDPTSITSGYIRNIGHLHYINNSTYPDYWVLKFKPSNDWTEII